MDQIEGVMTNYDDMIETTSYNMVQIDGVMTNYDDMIHDTCCVYIFSTFQPIEKKI